MCAPIACVSASSSLRWSMVVFLSLLSRARASDNASGDALLIAILELLVCRRLRAAHAGDQLRALRRRHLVDCEGARILAGVPRIHEAVVLVSRKWLAVRALGVVEGQCPGLFHAALRQDRLRNSKRGLVADVDVRVSGG